MLPQKFSAATMCSVFGVLPVGDDELEHPATTAVARVRAARMLTGRAIPREYWEQFPFARVSPRREAGGYGRGHPDIRQDDPADPGPGGDGHRLRDPARRDADPLFE